MAETARRKIINVCSKGFEVLAATNGSTMKKESAYLIQNNTPPPAKV